jgi:hypothetical protein
MSSKPVANRDTEVTLRQSEVECVKNTSTMSNITGNDDSHVSLQEYEKITPEKLKVSVSRHVLSKQSKQTPLPSPMKTPTAKDIFGEKILDVQEASSGLESYETESLTRETGQAKNGKQNLTQSEIEDMKTALKYAYFKYKNGVESLPFELVSKMVHSTKGIHSTLDDLGLAANIILAKGEVQRETHEGIGEDNAVMALADVFSGASPRVYENHRERFRQNVYPNLSEYTNGVWSSYLDQKWSMERESAQTYGRLGEPLVDIDHVRRIAQEYEKQAYDKMKPLSMVSTQILNETAREETLHKLHHLISNSYRQRNAQYFPQAHPLMFNRPVLPYSDRALHMSYLKNESEKLSVAVDRKVSKQRRFNMEMKSPHSSGMLASTPEPSSVTPPTVSPNVRLASSPFSVSPHLNAGHSNTTFMNLPSFGHIQDLNLDSANKGV